MQSLTDRIDAANETRWPRLHDTAAAARIEGALAGLSVSEKVRRLISAGASGSPYLERLIMRNQAVLQQLLKEDITSERRRLVMDARRPPETVDETKAHLRQTKDRLMLLLSLCDLSDISPDLAIMETLTEFADAAVVTAFSTALRQVLGVSSTDLLERCGLVILAMGKHGAGELNYSSDIDLVVFYDPQVIEEFAMRAGGTTPVTDARKVAINATKLAVAILQDLTEDGYVFRTDLRLRPDPGTSNIAVTITAAERYYEAYGQNWERAAFSKARVVAGHKDASAQVDGFLRPFIWRKYLDYAAIEDIHSIKRQIHAVKGQGTGSFAGHDLKLGRGGIREIEFFVQTQQLILGGRNPALRERTTLGGLQALAEAGHITSQTEKELRTAYLLLRRTEHRIQMVNDEQTHTVPKQPEQILRLAHLAGYDDAVSFEAEVMQALRLVHDHYADLFEESENLSTESGSLVFTGVDDHPDTLVTLTEMGFSDASRVASTIRNWHAGGIRATKSIRAREMLTRLVPVILRSLAWTDNPQQGFEAFDALLRHMPGGVQFFSLVLNNPHVLESLIALSNLSPRLTREMAIYSHLIEIMLSPDFLEPDVPTSGGDRHSVSADAEHGFEEELNRLRRETRERHFQVTSRLLLTGGDLRREGRHYSRLAEAALNSSLTTARAELVRSHGDIEGGLAVIGMGRLGASALTATSDLDLIFIHDASADTRSLHERPLDGATWFSRYVRRLLTALSAQTEEGGLYEIDMALRPSGSAGPPAVTLNAFRRYYQEDAWTWEEMALVKARVVAGEAELARVISEEINHILTGVRDPEKVRTDVLDMRRRLLREKPASGSLDLKLADGGMTDIDFICQYLSLIHAHEHGRFPFHIADALLVFAAREVIPAADAELLLNAWHSYETVMQLSRAALGNVAPSDELPAPLGRVVARRLSLSGPGELAPRLAGHRELVQNLFRRHIGPL